MFRTLVAAAIITALSIGGAGVAHASDSGAPSPSPAPAMEVKEPKSLTYSISPIYNAKGRATGWEVTAHNISDNTTWTTTLPYSVATASPTVVRGWIAENAPDWFLYPDSTSTAQETTQPAQSDTGEQKHPKKGKKGKKGKKNS